MIYFFVGTLILLGLVLTAYNALNNATIRGLQNTIKMKDDRIEEMCIELKQSEIHRFGIGSYIVYAGYPSRIIEADFNPDRTTVLKLEDANLTKDS